MRAGNGGCRGPDGQDASSSLVLEALSAGVRVEKQRPSSTASIDLASIQMRFAWGFVAFEAAQESGKGLVH